MYVLKDSRVKASLLTAVVFTLQLLVPSLIYAQTNSHPTTISSPSTPRVSTWDTISTNRTDQAQDYLSQLRKPALRDSNNTTPLTAESPSEIGQLEWTGQYVERYVRVPEGNSGKAKLIRFLIPVYREKGTQRKTSVGTEDKQKN